MEAMDNPSYFTLPGSGVASLRAARGRILRIMGAASSSSSTSSSGSAGCGGARGHSAPVTPTSEASTPLRSPSGSASRRSFRFLVPSLGGGGSRGTRAEIRQLVLGHPRIPADTEPAGDELPPRQRLCSGERRGSSRDSDFADDMVYYNLPAPPPPRSEGEGGRGGEASRGDEGDARYYNLCAGRRRHSIGTFVSRERFKGAPGAREESTPRGNVTWGARRKAEEGEGAESQKGSVGRGRGIARGVGAADMVPTRSIGDASGVLEWRHHVRKRCHRCSSKEFPQHSMSPSNGAISFSARSSSVVN
ncbi:uncharacterized protein [Hetaerina americana]|uniref:uncharacterized protein n=1 Tax=Hetaerina americana TaxID=62018 RepID=UPI003A7F540B